MTSFSERDSAGPCCSLTNEWKRRAYYLDLSPALREAREIESELSFAPEQPRDTPRSSRVSPAVDGVSLALRDEWNPPGLESDTRSDVEKLFTKNGVLRRVTHFDLLRGSSAA